MQNLSAIVLGATGATGQELVRCLLEDPDYKKVFVFVRKKPKISHKKLTSYTIDFSKMECYKELIKGDVLFSCFGTTLKTAGSKDKQFLVDYTYQYEFAKFASKNGVKRYALVSSSGAHSKSPFFYLKMKGKLEESVKKLKFKSIYIFQPPSLIRQDELLRNGEKLALRVIKGFNNLGFLKSQKPLPVSLLAKRMVNETKMPPEKKLKIFKNQEILNSI